MSKPSFWWVILALVPALAFALATASESLWLDELHTDWTISGGWDEIPARASLGNQSPLYSCATWGVAKTLVFAGPSSSLSADSGRGTRELRLRCTGLLAWLVSIVVAGGWLRQMPASSISKQPWQLVLLPLLFVALDRIQWFYATEARVYAWLQLGSLLGWLWIARMFLEEEASVANRAVSFRRWMVAWCLLSMLLMHLHLMSALAVAWQWLFGMLVLGSRRLSDSRRALRDRSAAHAARGLMSGANDATIAERSATNRSTTIWLAAGLSVAAGGSAAMLWTPQLWQRRALWESFAGDASFSNTLGLFPISVLLVPLVIALAVDRWLGTRTADQRKKTQTHHLAWRLWCVAAMGPWLTAWLITAAGIAPILHRRYVIVSAIPLAMLAACILARISRPSLRIVAGTAVLVGLVATQGTLDAWLRGEIVGWQRAEGWRQASAHVQQRYRTGDELWCASGLIEGSVAELPLSAEQNAYLSFPMRGMYALEDPVSRQHVAPRALVNDSRQWTRQWMDAGTSGEERTLWIIYRGSEQRLQSKLEQLRSELARSGYSVAEPLEIAPKGRVAVARMVIATSTGLE